MKEFCKTCPDQHGELCALPSFTESFSHKLRLAGRTAVEGVMYIGYAFSGGSSEGFHNDSKLEIARQRVNLITELVDDCIELHQWGKK